MNYGKKVWIFPDAELPPVGVNSIPGHESIIILNTGKEDANIKFTFYYTDREPVKDIEATVQAEKVRCFRTNEKKDFGSYMPTMGEQYAIVLESDVNIIAQYGRAEPRAVNFYTTPGYCSD